MLMCTAAVQDITLEMLMCTAAVPNITVTWNVDVQCSSAGYNCPFVTNDFMYE